MKYFKLEFKMAAVSKQEYLKRYLSNADSGEKKKRRKKVKTGIRTGKSLIIDDDVNLSDIKVRQDSETTESLLELADETPLIFNEAGTTVLSKDLESIKKKEDEKKAMWAPIRTFQDESSADIKTDQNAKNFSPKRSKARKVRHDSSSPERDSVKEKLSSAEQVQKRQRHGSEDLSPRLRTRHDSASDQSPPRQITKKFTQKATRNDSPDLSPRLRNMSSRSLSPTDRSPPRRTRHDSSSGQSPPRNQQNSRKVMSKASRNSLANMRMNRNVRSRSPVDQSPRRTRHDSSSDQSPPRNKPGKSQQRKARHDSIDLSPRNGRNIRLPSPDQSPPRRHRHDSPDLSPARRTRGSPPDQSPPRRQSGKRSFKDGNIDDDQSPPRKQKNSG